MAKMAKENVSDDLLLFSYELVKDTHNEANYYEERKNTLLLISLGIMAFGAIFAAMSSQLTLVYAGLAAMMLSFVSVCFYGIALMPSSNVRATIGRGFRFAEYAIDPKLNKRQNFDEYYKKLLAMDKGDVLYENVAHSLSMLYRNNLKAKLSQAMGLFIFLAAGVFFFLLFGYFL